MNRSQPIDINNEHVKKLGLTEELLKKSREEKQVVKTETVDTMFDFPELELNVFQKILVPFRRIKRRLGDFFRSVKVFRRWRGLFAEYYPLNIHSFLPLFIHHLENYIALEKKHGIATPECKDYKITTAQEAVVILKRLLADDYVSAYHEEVERKWGKFPYKKTTYTDGSVGFEHLTPSGYDDEMHVAYEKAIADEQSDLKRIGEIVEKNMLDWWD